MKYFLFILLFSVIQAFGQGQRQYPQVKTVNQVDTIWGRTVSDPYRWMENRNDPDLEEWLKSQKKLEEQFHNTPYNAVLEQITLFSAMRYNAAVKVGKYFFNTYYEEETRTPILYYSTILNVLIICG